METEILMPAATDAEKLVLGCAMIDREVFPRLQACLSQGDFFIEAHRRIFGRMSELYQAGSAVDRVTVMHALMAAKQLESVGGASYLISLDEGLPNIGNLDSYVQLIQDKAILRRAITACQSAITECLSQSVPTAAILARLDKISNDLRAAKAGEMRLRHALDVIQSLGGANALISRERVRTQPTPWERLNLLIGGFEAGQLIVIGGRPGHGKTALACQIASHCASRKLGAAIFSLEMSDSQIIHRLLSERSSVSLSRIRQADLDSDQKQSVLEALTDICDDAFPLLIADKCTTVPALRSALIQVKSKRPIECVVVDYLQLLESIGTRDRNRNQELSEISRSLKLMAIEFDVVMVVCSQLSRDHVKTGQMPQLSDLRDSGAIESDADMVLFPVEDSQLKPVDDNAPSPINLIVAKNRNGRVGRIPLVFEKKFVRFMER